MILKNVFIGCLFSVLGTVNLGSNPQISKQISIKEVLISAHRGGPTDNFPENALETFQNTLENVPNIMLEMDVVATKDGELILMHDSTLERTTTLKGNVKEKSLKEIQAGFLIDKNGLLTNMKVPTLKKIFEWAADKNVFLSIDVKDETIFKAIIEMVRKHKLKEKIEIITYSIDDAQLVHNYDPEIFISMSIGSMEVLQKVLETNINPLKIAAFTGSSIKEHQFYRSLTAKGITVTLGTMGNLDKSAQTKSFTIFKQWKALGINRFATDYPLEVFNTFNK